MPVQMYNPVLAWANQHFDVKFAVSNSIFGAVQQPETHQAVKHYLEGSSASTSSSLLIWQIHLKSVATCTSSRYSL